MCLVLKCFVCYSVSQKPKMAAFMLKTSSRLLICFENVFKIPVANYAKPAGVPGLGTKKAAKGAKLAPVAEKRILPVETDTEKLVNFVCGSNILKQGQDIQIKPDAEYPDWLWSMKLEAKSVPLEEMDQNTLAYWRRLRKMAIRRQSRLMRLSKY